jgi:hypothetical protein
MRSIALAAILLSVAPQALHAAQPAHTPARMLEGDRSIEALLALPWKLRTGLHKVYCEAQIATRGRTERLTCYALEDSASPRLVDAVARAARRARFAPATRNGVPADVYMLFMVRVYVPADGEPAVLALPNNGIEEDRYGLFYTAPQRFNNFYWGAGLPIQIFSRRVIVWQRLQIDESGKVTELSVTGMVGATSTIIRSLEDEIRAMEFMPGLVNGKAVPMRYAEPAFSGVTR